MYKDIIKNINAINFEKYASVSSNEKLVVYACKYMLENGIPLTFNYICVVSFKLFPDKFYFDDEFKEYPHIEKLNRTILHTHTSKTSNLLTGSAKTGYKITEAGKIVANQVESDINSGKIVSIKKTAVNDYHKKGTVQDYYKLINSTFYMEYVNKESNIELNNLWNYFQVIPFTKIKDIVEHLTILKNHAKSTGDETTIKFVENYLSLLSSK